MSQSRGIAVSDIHLLCPQAPSLQDLPPSAVAQNIPSIAASIALDIQAGGFELKSMQLAVSRNLVSHMTPHAEQQRLQ